MIAARLERIRDLLAEAEIDVLLISGYHNRRYLSAFNGSTGSLLIGPASAHLLTDFRYREQAAAQAEQFELRVWKKDFYTELRGLIEEAGWSRMGFEARHVYYDFYREMKEKLPLEPVPVRDTAETMRRCKSEEELEIMRRGAALLDRGFEQLCALAAPGLPERDLALELEYFLRQNGAEGPAFPFIVASGPRGAMPHGGASSKSMARGELVTIDFGAYVDGYATDMTRTISLGPPNEQGRKIYDLVRKAHHEAVISIKPGLKGREVDAVARKVIEKEGFGEYFGHGLGHGVGLETHEQPVLNPRSETMLLPGMVITVEPGIYIPGWGGIRIEDMILITDSGADLLTNSTRDLIRV